MRLRNVFPLLAVTLLVPAASGCAGSKRQISTGPLTLEEARAFDHGVDFVAALGGLEGRWRTDYDADLDLRVGTSDFVAIMAVDTVHSDTDPEQRVNHRLVGPVKRVIFGENLKELQLVSRDTDEGYDSVSENLVRIQKQDFVVYGKWYAGESGHREAHFHLSPATEEILTQTETRAVLRENNKPNKAGERVIVTNH
jgi:hypothetical protein